MSTAIKESQADRNLYQSLGATKADVAGAGFAAERQRARHPAREREPGRDDQGGARRAGRSPRPAIRSRRRATPTWRMRPVLPSRPTSSLQLELTGALASAWPPPCSHWLQTRQPRRRRVDPRIDFLKSGPPHGHAVPARTAPTARGKEPTRTKRLRESIAVLRPSAEVRMF